MNLEEAIPYLVERGLLTPTRLVGTDVLAEESSRRNWNLRVTLRQGPGFFIKEADRSNDLTTGAIATEARYYGVLQALPVRVAPMMHLYDPDRQLLVLDLVQSAITLNQLLDRPPIRPQTATLSKLARILAICQTASADAPPAPGVQIPWALRFMIPGPDLLRTTSQGQLEVIRRIQADAAAFRQLAQCRREYAGRDLVHGDLRFDNVLVNANAVGESRRLWIVDWELATIGDEAWDVGTVLASLLARCLRHMEPGDVVNAQTLRQAFNAWLPRTRPEIAAFWNAFKRAKRLERGHAEAALLRATCYCGAKLLQTAFEWSLTDVISPMAACQLQLGLNILRQPREAATVVLGLLKASNE